MILSAHFEPLQLRLLALPLPDTVPPSAYTTNYRDSAGGQGHLPSQQKSQFIMQESVTDTHTYPQVLHVQLSTQ